VAEPLSLLFVMDPIGSIDIDKDTTFALMFAAQERGHRVLYCELADLSLEEGRPVARARAVTLRRTVGDHATLGEPRTLPLDDALDAVFQRKDPPVDVDYVTATQILALCRRALVLNRPDTVIWANEKLYACQFPDLMPETRVSRRMPEFMDFLAKLGGEMIVKPLGGKGGEGVFHLRHDDRNLFSILEQVTGFGTRWAMAQQYVPEVRRGDKRILLLDGEPLGAVLRVPAAGETRANLHVGGTAVRTGLDEHDLRIVDRLRPHLLRDGLFFVGIDVIGGRLTEVNVTSPTGIQEIGALEGIRLEGRVIERLEQRVAERKKTA
jgi:glutathione synthase